VSLGSISVHFPRHGEAFADEGTGTLADQVLSSFTSTLGLQQPAAEDVDAYRSYLATVAPIAEVETRFLDVVEDLVDLTPHIAEDKVDEELDARPSSVQQDYADEAYSPGSQSDSDASTPASQLPASGDSLRNHLAAPSPRRPGLEAALPARSQVSHGSRSSLMQFIILCSISFLLPTVGFTIISDFLIRMALVTVTGCAATAIIMVRGMREKNSFHLYSANGLAIGVADVLTGFVVYGGIMAIVAAVIR
jgi:hypothetical protein